MCLCVTSIISVPECPTAKGLQVKMLHVTFWRLEFGVAPRMTEYLETPVLCYTIYYHDRSIPSLVYLSNDKTLTSLLSMYLNLGIQCHYETVTWVNRLYLAVGCNKLRQVTSTAIIIQLNTGEDSWTLRYTYYRPNTQTHIFISQYINTFTDKSDEFQQPAPQNAPHP